MRRGVWAGAAVVALALAGCANPGEVLAEKVIEQGLSQDGTKVDIDADGDGGISMEFKDGTEYQAGDHAQVPDDFPSDMPLPDAQLLAVVKNDGGFLLQYQVSDRVAYDEVASKLDAAGFEETASIEMEGMTSKSLSSDAWNVSLGLLGEGDELTLSYGVYPASE